MIGATNRYGPWSDTIDDTERPARLRATRALARTYAGPRAVALCRLLAQAETNPEALEPSLRALNQLEPVDRRPIPAAPGALDRPAA